MGLYDADNIRNAKQEKSEKFYKDLIVSLVLAFDYVRKLPQWSDMTLREELTEYLTPEELDFVFSLNDYEWTDDDGFLPSERRALEQGE